MFGLQIAFAHGSIQEVKAIRKKKALTALVITVMAVIVLWAATVVVDYWRVRHDFERPLFATASLTADDGGSGTSRGLGYTIELEGNFLPEDEFPGVTAFRFYLFGNCIAEGIRD